MKKTYIFFNFLKLLKFFIFFILNLFIMNKLFAQKNIKFEHIALKDGLSQSSVACILQDNKGFMWFGTYDGLNKYDGYKIKIYRKTTDSLSIPENSVTCIFQDNNNDIWLGISGCGLVHYNKYTEVFKLYQNDKNNINTIIDNNINSVYQDINSNLWIATPQGLDKLDLKTKTFTHFSTEQGLSSNTIKSVTGKNEQLWIGTSKGINLLNINTNTINIFDTSNTNLTDMNVNCLYIDKQNTLWIGTANGLNSVDLFRYNLSAKFIVTRYVHDNNKNSISDNQITCILQDYEYKIWIGTKNGGLNKYNKDNQEFTIFKNNPRNPNSMSNNEILSIYEDDSNILWIGTSLGGINKYNRIAKAFNTLQNNPSDVNSLSSDQVRTIYEDSKGIIWFGTVYGGLNSWNQETNTFTHYKNNQYDPTSLSDNYIRAILEDADGEYWIGTDTAGISKFDPITGKCVHYKHNINNQYSLSDNKIWQIFQDSKKRIWIATWDGLNLFDKKTGKFTAYKHNEQDSNSIYDNKITRIIEDSQNNLWIGTWDGGLNRFDFDNQKFIRYKNHQQSKQTTDRILCITEDKNGDIWTGNRDYFSKIDVKNNTIINYDPLKIGFINNRIMSLLQDTEENFWISTNNGLVKYNIAKQQHRTYFETEEFMVGAYLKTSKGQLLIGGINGVKVFFPNEIKDNPHAPNIVITGFKVLNQDVKLDTTVMEKKVINLSYEDNEFSFEFVALDYGDSEKNKYAYILVGYDKDTILADNRKFVSYTNLDPGKYTLKIMGANNDGKWNKNGTEITIIIATPFWKKPWFFIFITVVIITIIYAALKYRDITKIKRRLENLVVKRTEEINQQKEEIIAQLEQIEQQKNNLQKSYNNIKLLSQIGQKITSNLSMDKIIETFHEQLNKLMDATFFAIGLYNSHNNRLDFIQAKENSNEIPDFSMDVNLQNCLGAWCFLNKKDVFINDFDNEYINYVPTNPTDKEVNNHTNSIIYLPIISKNNCIGVITIQSYKKHQYTNNHLNMLRNLAVYAAIAFENTHAYTQIEKQKKGITDSIMYAKRIQSAVVTPKNILDEVLQNYFLIFMPRDIVSGDFYLVKKIRIKNDNIIILVAADCTGHGVPGAFMSMLGISLLNEIIAYYENIQQINSELILNNLRDAIIQALHQTGKTGEPQDGMDMSLCVINTNTKEMQFSGANNPLYLIRKDKNGFNFAQNIYEHALIEMPADRMPIGFYLGKKSNFSRHIIDIQNEDTIYMFSDGYVDQFGGENGKKFLTKNFKKLLLSIQNKNMELQKDILVDNIQKWKNQTDAHGNIYEQVDDILILSVKF